MNELRREPGIRTMKARKTTSAATGRFDGYQADVSLGTLPRGRMVRFTVQVACIAARTPP
jgi:hypothetical protein